MRDTEPLGSVTLARDRLVALRAHFSLQGKTPGAVEAERALRELQELLDKLHSRYALLREILDRSSDVVFAKDLEGRYVMMNPNGARLFGKSVEEILGQDDSALFERKSADRIMEIDRVVMSTGEPRSFEESFEIRGVQVTLQTSEAAWYEPHGKLCGLIGTAHDMTGRRRVEHAARVDRDRLRSLASNIVVAEECLRQSLAANLQNSLGQEIALAKMKLAALRSSAATELHDPLLQIERLVEQADLSLRTISFQLSPPSLHDLGLVPALEWLAEDIGGRHQLSVRIEDAGIPDLTDPHRRVILFRAVRELLLNAATHAQAGHATVKLTADGKRLHIVVADDGHGFDAAALDHEGYGLFGIREQLGHLGGKLKIDSAPGRGTSVSLTMPLEVAAVRP